MFRHEVNGGDFKSFPTWRAGAGTFKIFVSDHRSGGHRVFRNVDVCTDGDPNPDGDTPDGRPLRISTTTAPIEGYTAAPRGAGNEQCRIDLLRREDCRPSLLFEGTVSVVSRHVRA